MDGSQVLFGTVAGSVQSVNHAPQCTTCPPDTIVVVPPLGSGTVPVSVKTTCGTSNSFTGMVLPSDKRPSASKGAGSTPTRSEFRLVGLRGGSGLVISHRSQAALRDPLSAGAPNVMKRFRSMEGAAHPPTAPTYTFWPNVWPNPGLVARRVQGPAFAAVTPSSAPMAGGTLVTVRGNGFTGATAINFGATSGTISSVDPSGNSLQAVMPQVCGYGTVDVTVTTPVGTSPIDSWDQFTVTRGTNIPTGCDHPLQPKVIDPCLFNRRPVICYLDISSSSGLAEKLTSLAGLDITLGVAPHQFCPACSISRADWAAVLARGFQLQQPPQSVALTDVPRGIESQVDYLAIEAVTPHLGFVLRRNGFAFHPEAAVNRQAAISSVVSILADRGTLKLEKAEDADEILRHIPDSSAIDAPLRVFIATAVKDRLFEVKSPGGLGPLEPLTREEAATILYDALRRANP